MVSLTQISLPAVAILLLSATASALPQFAGNSAAALETREPQNSPQPETVPTVQILYHAAAASFIDDVPADGYTYPPSRPDLNINLVEFLNTVNTKCQFNGYGGTVLTVPATPGEQFAVGPPQPIEFVSCQFTTL